MRIIKNHLFLPMLTSPLYFQVKSSWLPNVASHKAQIKAQMRRLKTPILLFQEEVFMGRPFLNGLFHLIWKNVNKQLLEIVHTRCFSTQCGKTGNCLKLEKNSWNQLFINFFSKYVAFTKFMYLCKKLRDYSSTL